MIPSAGYVNGNWIPQQALTLSIIDDGFRYAATAVERLRTYQGRPFQTQLHLDRWQRTIAAIGIDGLPAAGQTARLLAELIDRNRDFVDAQGDVGITILATPGVAGASIGPTFILHLNAIDHDRAKKFRSRGQALVITDIVQPPETSWSRQIKVRCRLHYYLADQTARRDDPDASGLLLDGDGTLTETSIANIAIVRGGTIVSPPADQVLGGITQAVIERLASSLSIGWIKRRIQPVDVYNADEVLLMGTDVGIWFAHQVDQRAIRGAATGALFHQLRAAFDILAEGAHT